MPFNTLQDLITAVENLQSADAALKVNGTNSMLANLNFGGFKPINITSGTAALPAFCAGNDDNTGIFSPASDTWAVSTNGVEKVRINSTGVITVNKSGSGDVCVVTQYEGGAQGPGVVLRKSKSGTMGTNTIVADGDGLGAIIFQGANGSSFTDSASIIAYVDGAPGASNDMPGRIVFSTTADGSGSTTERMRITNQGFVGIGTTAPTSALQVSGFLDFAPDSLGVHMGIANAYTGIELAGQVGSYIDFTTTGVDVRARIIYTNSSSQLEVGSDVSTIFTIGGGIKFSISNSRCDIPTDLFTTGNITTTSRIIINNSDPTILLQDTNNRSALLHCNSNLFYVLRGSGTNSTTWTQFNGQWPLVVDLENNNITGGGNITAVETVFCKTLQASVLIYGPSVYSTGNVFADGILNGAGVTCRGTGMVFQGSTIIGDANAMGLRWASPNIYGTVDNVVSAVLGVVSDYRLKHNFVEKNKALNIIQSLRPGEYNPIELDGTILSERRWGLLAHEVQNLLPTLVTGQKDATNESGNAIYQSIDYAGIVPYLIVAIKEQQAQIEELKKLIQ
jgi:hypothetical protein